MTHDHNRPRPTPGESVWGDESPAVDAVLDWVQGHVARGTDPTTTARPAASLAAATGPTITPEGIGSSRALQIFDEILVPATRAQEDPLNLAYIPSAPTRAAVAFDLATSVANIFGGHWETGSGAIHAENQVLAWLAGLLGLARDRRGHLRQRRDDGQPVRPGRRPSHRGAGPPRPGAAGQACRRLGSGLHVGGALLDPLRGHGPRRRRDPRCRATNAAA